MGTSIRAAYITADAIGGGTGGGQVVEHEIAALRRVFKDDVLVLSKADLRPSAYAGLDLPYLDDYFAIGKIAACDKLEYCHFYSGVFTETIRWLSGHKVKTGYTSPAHDLVISIAEFKRIYKNYPYPHLEDPKLWQQFSEGLRLADWVAVPSTLSEKFLQSQGVLTTQVMPHGHDPQTRWTLTIPVLHAPPAPSAPNPFVTFGYLGQVGPDKGLRLLLEAFDMVRANNVNPEGQEPPRLLLAGRGTEGLANLVRMHVGAGNVRLAGFVPDKATFWNAIDIYVQPSLTESFGIEVLEAMSASIPVITTQGVGAKDLVWMAGAGWIAETNAKALSLAMQQAIDNRSRWPDLGAAGQRMAAKNTWEEYEKKLEGRIRWELGL